jgi:hypothetical protein
MHVALARLGYRAGVEIAEASNALSQTLRWVALGSVVGLPLYANFARGRVFAIFGSVVLGLSLAGAVATEVHLSRWLDPATRPWIAAVWIYGVLAATAHFAHLVRARLRSRAFRVLISVPGQAFVGAGFLAAFWQLALWPLRGLAGATLGDETLMAVLNGLDFAPFVIALASIGTSRRVRSEWVRVYRGDAGPEQTQRIAVERSRRPWAPNGNARGLRIVQIADPHLGPWQSVRGLQRIIESLASHDPDLVLLTGDFLTMEGQGSPGALRDALTPLQPIAERCYAIFGNHDHEAPDEVHGALDANGIRLLVDAEAIAETPLGPVQLIGADYVGRGRREHIETLLGRYPRRAGHPRLLMLHDPLGFHDVPIGEADLTLSGHTHGGQVGLVSLGFDWTVLARSRWPDHGLFARGSNRLYVHRGTGFYGFPLRIGVPGEASVLEWVLEA